MTGYAIRAESEAPVDDAALGDLLRAVYVDGGFTDPDRAEALFRAADLRRRGRLLVAARDGGGDPAGMVLVVPPGSPARRIAREGEAEMHLLAVSPAHRGAGLGGRLVGASLAAARDLGCRRMVLWTQATMEAAQRLYLRAGFARAPGRDGDVSVPGRTFLVFERDLST